MLDYLGISHSLFVATVGRWLNKRQKWESDNNWGGAAIRIQQLNWVISEDDL
jgi:hypothetical protein